MPLYEYQCDGTCGQRFEVIQKFSDPPVEKCPKCGGPVHKLLSSPAIQFKGSGWYVTDYARKEHTSAGKTDASGKSTDSASSEKTEKAPEKKTDTTPAPPSPSSTTSKTPSKD